MKCPACKNVMIVVEHNRIELDYCVKCSGVWFDAGELDLLFETMHLEQAPLALNSMLTAPETDTKELKRKCPICGKKMKKSTVGYEPKVLIDACKQGDGLWFDKGEVGQLISQMQPSPSEKPDQHGRVIQFLGEVFQAKD